MEIVIRPGRSEMGEAAATAVAAKMRTVIAERGEVNVAFAAAPSQNEFLAALRRMPNLDWSCVNALHLDEYVDLQPWSPQGFGNYLRFHLFDHVHTRHTFFLGGRAEVNPETECRRYADLLRRHPLDLACLGIGENGHLALNDPGAADFSDPELVKVVSLDARCRQQQVNDGCFVSLAEVPTEAFTLTIPALFAAAALVAVVPGPTKAAAVKATVTNPVAPSCPATILRTHPNAMLFLDQDSAALL